MKISVETIKTITKNKQNISFLLIAGIVILLLSNSVFSSENKKTEKKEKDVTSISIKNDEERLEKILSKVYGAGKTDVMITYDTGVEKITVKNSKISKSTSDDTEKSGGETSSTQISEEHQTVMNGSGNSLTPFVTKEVNPRVRGVLVVADGAGDETVRYNLTNAVAAVLDVPYYRIQVLKKSN